MNRKLRTLLASGMVCLALVSGGAPVLALAAADDVSYGIELVNTQHKTVKLFTKAELESLSGKTLTASSVASVYSALSSADVWETAGYSQAHAKLIANRFKLSRSEAQGILKSIAYNDRLGFKIIVETNYYRTDAHLGKESIQQNGGSTGGNTGSGESTPGVTIGEIKDFQLQIEYAKKDIELQYNPARVTKAKYVNGLTGENIKGDKVTAIFDKAIKDVDFTASEKDIAAKVLANLGAATNYKELQLEVQFVDGSELEIEFEK